MMDASAEAPGKVVTLHFGGDALRISHGGEVRAEHLEAGKRWCRVWPSGRLLQPDAAAGWRSTQEWILPDGLTWADVFAHVPPNLLSTVARFSLHQWRLLEFAHNHPEFRDLLLSNAGLAYALACNDEFRPATPEEAARRAQGCAARKQRDIARYLKFPATEASVRILKQLIPEALNPSSLRMLRSSLPLDSALSRMISHARSINTGALAFLTQSWLRGFLSPRLFNELIDCEEEKQQAPTADFLKDILRMGEGIPGWKPPQIQARARIREVHERALLAYLAEQERIRRFQEAERERLRVQQEAAYRREAERRARLKDIPFPDPPIPGTPAIAPIVSDAELKLEGLMQRNCVGTMSDGVKEGRVYFYKVLSPERATMAIAKEGRDELWHLREIKGKANRHVSRQTIAIVHAWLNTQPSRQPRRGWNDLPF